MMPRQKPGRSKQDYGTPPEFIAAVEARFGPLVVDLAAREDNKKAPVCLTPEIDSLGVDWTLFHGLCWLNPPYSNIEPWAAKCADTATLAHPTHCGDQSDTRIAFLVPASVGSNWFREHVHGHALVLALNPRLTFEGCTTPYPKDCILCVYGEPTGFDVWRWK